MFSIAMIAQYLDVDILLNYHPQEYEQERGALVYPGSW